MDLYKRLLSLPPPTTETFFLWGARQTGKSSLLRQAYPGAVWIDLLKADVFRRYSTRPESLREEELDRLIAAVLKTNRKGVETRIYRARQRLRDRRTRNPLH